jgi:AraC family transcriptional regulator
MLGESVAEFTRRLRLERAAQRLTYGANLDITSLALDLGFSISQNFAKAFKKHFDVSPSEYHEQAVRYRVSQRDEVSLVNKTKQQVIEHDSVAVGHGIDEQVCVKNLDEQQVVYFRHFGLYNSAEVESAFPPSVLFRPPSLEYRL